MIIVSIIHPNIKKLVQKYCLKYRLLLEYSSQTTCHLFRRKDLPLFLAKEGDKKHAQEFSDTRGIVDCDTKYNKKKKKYSERHCWLTNTFDPYLHSVTLYHRSGKKWTFIQATLSSRNPIISIICSSLIRRYIQICKDKTDNYRLMLSLSNDLKERIDLRLEDFRIEIEYDEFNSLKEIYLKDIILLRIYGIQEYGDMTNNQNLMWISDELNSAFISSWDEFFSSVKQLVPIINQYIINAAQDRREFFPEPEQVA